MAKALHPRTAEHAIWRQEEPGRSKITWRHHERLAYVYIRQSSPFQVHQNQESTRLQYHLVDRAMNLGWSRERICVIDEDLGKSGQNAERRSGIQRLLSEVSLDHVGLILSIETSRLARSCKDWYHLLELCGMFGTLLADAEGIWDPVVYSDRLFLGLSGMMSEAELHVMRSRLVAGKLNKARRGELFGHVPTGYVRQASGEVTFDPDEQVCATLRLIFDKFAALKSAHAVLRFCVEQNIMMGFRHGGDTPSSELVWRPPEHSTIQCILHNPFYAGVYAYGRRHVDPRSQKQDRPYSGVKTDADPEHWKVFLKDALPAYISWEQYRSNQEQLAANHTRLGATGVAREGRSLLHGLLVCKKCGYHLATSYSKKGFFQYQCNRAYSSRAAALCQSFSGQVIDALVARELLHAIEPASLELSLSALATIEQEQRQIELAWRQKLERARYTVERAERQYHQVEPENRLVARSLERAWEQALTEERALQEEYSRFASSKPKALTHGEVQLIRELAADLPALWNASSTCARDRQLIVRYLIDHVVVDTHDRTDAADVEIHWKGGHICSYPIHHHVRSYKRRHDYAQLKARILELRQQGYTAKDIAESLNAEGYHPAKNAGTFKVHTVQEIVQHGGLPKVYDQDLRLRPFLNKNEWTLNGLAQELEIPYQTLYAWRRKNWLKTRWLEQRQGRWLVWADKSERKRLKALYMSHPQNR